MKKRRRKSGLPYRPLVRALKLFVALCRSRFGLTILELLDEIECSRRTLYRYLGALEEAGVRIATETNPSTGQVLRKVHHIDGRRIQIGA